ncbi:MAG: aminodeoxychorismate/anthranilate synthase component II [Legionellaceae bacterium]|nr:aminodeoxychorismate/anthranilate synthase component II [Legionellaceae bacterium]
MVLIIDNYDSFTYNLVHYFQILGESVTVFYNDALTLEDIKSLNPSHIVLSPGPNQPEDAGISLSVIKSLHPLYPMLGVCLGHQCLAQALGAKIRQADYILHGKTSLIQHKNQGLFSGLPQNFRITRYHSLVVEPTSLPSELLIDATVNQEIMALRHRTWPLFGLQFHPEAILSEYGLTLLEHFIRDTSQPNLRTTDRQKRPVGIANAWPDARADDRPVK